MRAYQTVNEETGEVKDKFLYFPGMPKGYRFDARTGQFNIEGKKPLLDKKGSPVKNFTFQPISFRFFTDQMFGRERVERWIEIFFADERGHISAIMFNGTNVEPFETLLRTECLYEGITLTDLVITATPTQVTSKKDPSKSWYVVELTSDLADEEVTKQLSQFDEDFKIFRKETVNDNAVLGLVKSHYFEGVLALEPSSEKEAINQ